MTASHSTPAATASVRLDLWWLVSIGSVLVAVVVASVFSPDLVTGAEQEHLPLAALLCWVWGAVAVGYLSYVGRDAADATLAIATAVLWAAVAATSIAAPELVTGSDPTRVPLAALVAPVVGAVSTGFLSMHALRRAAPS